MFSINVMKTIKQKLPMFTKDKEKATKAYHYLKSLIQTRSQQE